jgi:hypothetical protein
VITYKDYFQDGYRFRTFPEVEEKTAQTDRKIDYAIPLASIPQHLWHPSNGLPSAAGGYLMPDLSLSDHFTDRLRPYAKKRKIGLSWRSGKMEGERRFGYFGIEGANALAALENTVFVCLQYGAEQAEIDAIRKDTGIELIVFDDVDLKDDIEANLAIMNNLDCVVGPNIATQMMAFSAGAETSIITWGLPWWAEIQPKTRALINNPHCRIYNHDGCGWQYLMESFVKDVQKSC